MHSQCDRAIIICVSFFFSIANNKSVHGNTSLLALIIIPEAREKSDRTRYAYVRRCSVFSLSSMRLPTEAANPLSLSYIPT